MIKIRISAATANELAEIFNDTSISYALRASPETPLRNVTLDKESWEFIIGVLRSECNKALDRHNDVQYVRLINDFYRVENALIC